MTIKERVLRMIRHQEADRIPILDSPWKGTLRRWRREGMPEDVEWEDYFGTDKRACIRVDISPRYPVKVLSEDDRSTKRGI